VIFEIVPQLLITQLTSLISLVLIITGQRKALALSKCIEEGVNHLWTVSAIQLHPWALVCCDKEATMELRVKTVEYFKSIEIMQDEVEQYQERERKKLVMNGATNGVTNGAS
jgi:glucosamine-6-phosphate deaminase